MEPRRPRLHRHHAVVLLEFFPNLSLLLAGSRILQSLPPSCKGFVLNYNMQGMEKTIPELYSMLKSAEVEIKKEHQVLMVNKTTSFKKGKGKKNFKKDGKAVAAPGKPDARKKKKNGPNPETECFYCKGKGHRSESPLNT
ncbi:hypothetical protein ZWY2020_020307 [Hordeum vulgare]|nr:hypothetical protein ZWY2020_020307 [Hordeum vulgare]